MDAIMGRISDATTTTAGNTESLFLADHINKMREDFKSQLMSLCDGDVKNYEAIKKLSVEDYLIKLDNFVSHIETLTRK
jgi:hypothetical protein